MCRDYSVFYFTSILWHFVEFLMCFLVVCPDVGHLILYCAFKRILWSHIQKPRHCNPTVINARYLRNFFHGSQKYLFTSCKFALSQCFWIILPEIRHSSSIHNLRSFSIMFHSFATQNSLKFTISSENS